MGQGHAAHPRVSGPPSLNRTAVGATLHCLTGCAIGEVLGLVIASELGWDVVPSISLAVVLAFFFGYLLTIGPLLRGGLPFATVMRTALAADTLSITVMEITDNAIILAIPGAMEAGVADPLFWGSLAVALAVAFLVTLPVNRWLIGRGLGHAVVHGEHGVHGGVGDHEGTSGHGGASRQSGH